MTGASDALRLLRMAALERLAIPGQNKTPRKGLVFADWKRGGFEFACAERIFRWEAEGPEQWLLRTGRVDVAGDDRTLYLVVVDADCEAAVTLCEELLPSTPWTVATPHGRHYYYLSADLRASRLLQGLDRKAGSNSYVVGPGNVGYVPSAEWGQGWPPELALPRWQLLEETWLIARAGGEAMHNAAKSGSGDRPSSGPRPGASRWKTMAQRCRVHKVCEGRRNAYVRTVAMRFLFRCRRKDGCHANRARAWNYLVKVNANNFGHHRLGLSEISSILTKAMADVRRQFSETAWIDSQASKGRLSGIKRGLRTTAGGQWLAKRDAGVRAARMAGTAIQRVASLYQLSTRQVSRIAPTRGPRSATAPHPALSGDRGGRGEG